MLPRSTWRPGSNPSGLDRCHRCDCITGSLCGFYYKALNQVNESKAVAGALRLHPLGKKLGKDIRRPLDYRVPGIPGNPAEPVAYTVNKLAHVAWQDQPIGQCYLLRGPDLGGTV